MKSFRVARTTETLNKRHRQAKLIHQSFPLHTYTSLYYLLTSKFINALNVIHYEAKREIDLRDNPGQTAFLSPNETREE